METLRVPDTHVLGWTPGTSLRVAGTGRQDERALLLRLALDLEVRDSDAVIELMRDRADRRDSASSSTTPPRARSIRRSSSASAERIGGDEFFRLKERWNATMIGCRAMGGATAAISSSSFADASRACLHVLKPRLVILDEFQRYPDVLRDAEQATKLEHVFSGSADAAAFGDAVQDERRRARRRVASRVRATAALPVPGPVEGQGRDDRARGAQHEFLPPATTRGPRSPSLRRARPAAKQQVERRLLPIMSRWQRPHDDEATRAVPLVPKPEDIKSYLAFQRVVDIAATAGGLRHRMTVEYWKSAPYLMSFMRGYKVKSAVDDAWKQGDLRRTMARAWDREERLCRCGISSSTDEVPVPHRRYRELADLALERAVASSVGTAQLSALRAQWTLQARQTATRPRSSCSRGGVSFRLPLLHSSATTPNAKRARRGRKEHHRGAKPPQLRPAAFAALRRTQRPPATQRALACLSMSRAGRALRSLRRHDAER